MAIRYLILALTDRCNLQCRYCYRGDSSQPQDMPAAMIEEAISLAERGGQPFHLQLTGGEPTLVPESIATAASLAEKSSHCQSIAFQTNATRLNSDLLTLFKKHDIQMGVSLDGPPAIHEKQRGMAAETLRGLQLLESAGIPFRVTTVVTQANVSALDQLVLTLAGFGCARGIGLDLLVAKGRGEENGDAVPAGVQELEQGVKRMLTALKMVNPRRAVPIRLREQDLIVGERKRKEAFCHACRGESLAVDPQGKLFPCGQTMGDSHFAAGTIAQPQLDKLGSLAVCRPDKAVCAACDLESICPGDCPSRVHYNREAGQELVCRLYRTIWKN